MWEMGKCEAGGGRFHRQGLIEAAHILIRENLDKLAAAVNT